MTFDDDVPVAEPRADLAPVARRPPTTTGQPTPLLALLERAVTQALDLLDAAGDAVAERLGLRPAAGEPPTSAPPPT
jgi:hypothetical protein